MKDIRVVLLGPPGAGKGTQSNLVVEKFGIKHISTGDIIRSVIKTNKPISNTLKGYVDKGQLVPDNLVIELIENYILDFDNFIFDGFPRTVIQAKLLAETLKRLQKPLTNIIDIHIDDNCIVERIKARSINNSSRSDDNLSIIRKRIEVYNTETKPVSDFFRSFREYCSIDGIQSIETIFIKICSLIK